MPNRTLKDTGVFEIVRVVGRGLVSIAEVHAIVAGAHHAQSEPEMARDRFGFLVRHGVRRGTTSTPALLRRAIARRERSPAAIGIEAKSCSEFRAEEVPLLILDRRKGVICDHGCDEQMFGAE
jgi:hypothetical protein